MDPNAIIKRYEQLSSNTERSNFNDLWQNCADYCNPSDNNINQVVTAGELKSINRLIDIGIRCERIFTSGLTSHLIPAGQRFFAYGTSDTKLKNVDAVSRYFNDCTQITYDYLNSSNFFEEMTKAIGQLGYIGTSCVLTEPSEASVIRYKTFHIDNFYIAESAEGNIDTVYFKLDMNSRQIKQMFGKDTDMIPELVMRDTTGEQKFCIIHAVSPRSDSKKNSADKSKKPIASTYVCMESKTVIRDTGYDMNPFAVGRFYQSSNEIYGRCPAADSLSTLSMLNAMESTRLRTAQRSANPPWMLPTGGDTKWVSNEQGSIIYYNANRGGSKPEQVQVKDNIMVTEAMIEAKSMEVEYSFFVDLFDSLGSRRNMTAEEVATRQNNALQSLVPPVGRVTNELLSPVFKRTYEVLQKAGKFPVEPVELKGKEVVINFNSRATLAQKQLETAGVRNVLMDTMALSESNPEILDLFDMDAIIRLFGESEGVPNTIIKSEYDVNKIRKARAEQQAQQQQLDQAEQEASIYQKTNENLQPDSAAASIMSEIGLPRQ